MTMSAKNTDEIIYSYLYKNYKTNEPIFLSDVKIKNIDSQSLRYYMNKLAGIGKIGKFDSGTFYLPEKDLFGNPSPLSPLHVADAKYIKIKENVVGFYSGNTFANYIGISDQVPFVKEICTNNATAPVRTVVIGTQKFVTRKPPVKITNENFHILQFLDCLKNLDSTADRKPEECKYPLSDYCQKNKITKSDIDRYIRYFPNKIYKSIYQTGVKFYVSA